MATNCRVIELQSSASVPLARKPEACATISGKLKTCPTFPKTTGDNIRRDWNTVSGRLLIGPSSMAHSSQSTLPPGVEIRGKLEPQFGEILTADALAFVAKLERAFGRRRLECLDRRVERQTRLDRGENLDFLPETRNIREADWECASIPPDLRDRRVEITGPTDRKMVINALNSGAKMFMADFEDANSPTWSQHGGRADQFAGRVQAHD